MALILGAPSLFTRLQFAAETPACSSFSQTQWSSKHHFCPVATSSVPFPTPSEPASPPKKILTMKKGDIVRVDKEKYLNSVEYLALGHPLNFKGVDYIYEDRGEILDVRIFETGEYALLGWAGISTSPAWLPTYMLIKSEKLSYKRT
ncbi:hypothetical protein GOP47_0018072 [Adiantum capillus-veneris]|uniref:Uncharacterized protein n=1 Tax=Adiantum capillus-veneris TaxID=13818 RepID=A0A9D4UHJ0_ADICA|nr:hypothetical protein GOP47_0018072 [Adiantum capillus-veneris]